GFAREHHLERQEEQQQATEYAEGLEADAHEVEEGSAAERKQDQNRGGDAHGLERHAALVRAGRASGEPGKQRDQRHRFDHHEELQRLPEHLVLCAKARYGALPAVTIIFLKASQARRNIIAERTQNRKSAGRSSREVAAMTTPQPGIGDWYRLNGGALFEVVA